MARLRIRLAGLAASPSSSSPRERSAAAYPQWQLVPGAVRCNECHYAPGGGGLINSYGRDAIGEQLSTFEGDGEFLHGKVTPPRWLALGGDLRGAFVANGVQDPNGATVAAFPMQADVGGARGDAARLLAAGDASACAAHARSPDGTCRRRSSRPAPRRGSSRASTT